MLLWIISWDNSGELSAQESWLPALCISAVKVVKVTAWHTLYLSNRSYNIYYFQKLSLPKKKSYKLNYNMPVTIYMHAHMQGFRNAKKNTYRMDVLRVGSIMVTSALTVCWERHTAYLKEIMFLMYK